MRKNLAPGPSQATGLGMISGESCPNNNNNNIRLVTLAGHTSDHGKQTNSSTKAKGEQG